MLTSRFFNRNDSAQYFVNMPEQGVCSLHGLLLSLQVIDKACCCYNTGCTLTAVRVGNLPHPPPLPPPIQTKSVLQTPRWARGIIYRVYLPTNFLIGKMENEMGGPCDVYTGKEKFLQVFGGEA
jgi:hypothetical protein